MKFRSLLFLLVIFAIVSSCDNKKEGPPKIDPAFTNHISAFTAGVITNEASIKIRLTEAYGDSVSSEEFKEDLFDFSPDIDGKLYWIDKHTLEFRPDSRLPSGVIYDAGFNLGKIKDVPSKLRNFQFRFQTIKQDMFVLLEGIQAYEDDKLQWQKLSGTVQTSDNVELEELQKTFSAVQNGIDLNVGWELLGDNLYSIVVDSVERKESAQKVFLAWNGEAIGCETKGESDIEIPALGDFTVMSIHADQLPEQKIVVHFSDPISASQSLEGLIYTEETDEFRFRKERNKVFLYPTRNITGARKLIVSKSVKNSLGYDLQEAATKDLIFESLKPSVRFIGSGNILPSVDGFKVPIKAVNLSGVNVKVLRIFEDNIPRFFLDNQYDGRNYLTRVARIVHKESISLVGEKSINYSIWNTFHLDLSKMIEVEPGAMYRISLSFDQSQSLYPCDSSGVLEQKPYIVTEQELETFESNNGYYRDYEEYRSRSGNYDYNERQNPCHSAFYQRGNNIDSKNILASNLGIIAKSGDENELKVIVTDLNTAEPISGASIEIYNLQNRLMETIKSDNDGFANVKLEYNPFLLIVKRGDDIGYLRVDDGSALSLSMFDVSGEHNGKGVKGFIYGERGVWRPGDSLYLSFILEDKNQSLPKDHPVVLELYTPENQLYTRIVKNKGVNGFYDLRTKTADKAPTGDWRVWVKVGNSVFEKNIKIEAIKPNRLKIKIDFEEDILTRYNTSGTLSSKWLHGADANGLRAKVEMNLSAGNTRFKEYKDYHFDDPAKDFYTEEEVVFDEKLDESGEAHISPEIYVSEGAPGMLQANFKTRVFEKGGDFSIDRFKTTFSPFDSYVGVKIPEGNGWRGALYSNEKNLIPIVTLDEKGNPVDRERLKVEIFEVRWRWWWERGEGNELANYVNNRSEYLIKSETVSTKDGKGIYELEFDKHRWGRKLIRITDTVSGHSTGATFYLSYSGWWNSGGNNPGGAEMLSFDVKKDKYIVGEKVELELPEIKEGRVLVSIESGSKVIKHFWKEASELKDGISFETTSDMAPNVYAHLTLIQPHSNTANDLPIRMYGVENILIEAPNTHLNPVIGMPDELAPEQEVNLKITEKDGKAMTYTIAVVDEGLLDLTRFRTPNPWPHFYKREALGVKTWDLYKYVLGAFSGEISGLLAVGGDDAGGNAKGTKANRFKPVVHFLGPYELEEGEENKHSFTMPNYVGSVRTMLIAGNQGAYGSTEKTTPVKKPLMVLATLPRVVSPSETLKLPVSVFAMDKKIKNVKVSVETNDFFTLDEKQKNLSFSKIGDQMAFFDLKVNERIGVGKVKVIVEGNGEKASHEIEIGIRLPNPEIDKTISGIVNPGESWAIDYEPIGVMGTNKGVIEVSSVPPINLEKRINYLIRYPHGCIEQTTSAAFPQLFIGDLMILSNERKKQIQNHITAALNKLRNFQTSSGGFSYWPGDYYVNSWGTNYAGHFLVEAKAKGYTLPTGLFKDWLKYQVKAANSWNVNSMNSTDDYERDDGELEQAYRLYTLALAGKATVGAMNRMRELVDLSEAAKWRLAAAYALTNRKDIAKQLIKSLSTIIEKDYYSYTYGSSTRDEAMILESLQLLGEKIRAKKVMERIAGQLSSQRWYSTQTTAYSLLAISKFLNNEGGGDEMNYTLNINGKSENVQTTDFINQSKLPMKKGKLNLKNNSSGTLFIQLSMSGIPLVSDNVDTDDRLKMTVQYLTMEEAEMDPSKIIQGTDFIAEVTITHPGYEEPYYKDLALNQIFPSGWEIRNLRMDGTSSNLMRDKPDYQDIRDDRVYSYFNLRRHTKKTYRVLLNAAYLGRFYLPAVECGAMYDNTIQSVKSGKWVEVVEAGK